MSYRQDSGEGSSSDCDYGYINYRDNQQSVSTPKQHDHFNKSMNLLNIPIPDDLLYDISEYICGNWKAIGRRLSIRETIIEAIYIDYNEEGKKEEAYQMLLTWKRQMGNSATVQQLGNVLKKIGRTDTAESILLLIEKKQCPTELVRTKSEIESQIKLQKLALQDLTHCVKFYQKKANELNDLSGRVLQLEEASQLEEKLRELNDMKSIQNTLDHLQMELKGMQHQSKEYAELDMKIRNVLERLLKVEQTVVQYEETLYDSPLVQCKFHCFFRVNLPSRSINRGERRRPAKLEKESDDDDDVFGSPNQRRLSMPTVSKPKSIKPTEQSRDRHVRFSGRLPQDRRNIYRDSIPHQRLRDSEEMHVRRRFNVSTLSVDEQFQMEEFVLSVTPRKVHEDKPFVFTHSCISQYLQQPVVTDGGSDMEICPITPEYFYPGTHSFQTMVHMT